MSVPTGVLCGADSELVQRQDQVLIRTESSEAALEAVRHHLVKRLVIDEGLLGEERSRSLQLFIQSFYVGCDVEVVSASGGRETAEQLQVRAGETSCIVLTSVKGGSGSTTIAVNLAAYLADIEGLAVSLVDLARPVGDVHLYLNRNPRTTVVDCIPFLTDEDSDAVHRTVERYGNLSVIYGVARPSLSELLDPGNCVRIIRALRGRSDIVIVDAGFASDPGGSIVANYCEATAAMVVVPDIACLSRLRFWEARDGEREVGTVLVVNKYETDGGMTHNEISRFATGSPEIVRIASAPGQVAHSWVSGRPLVQLRPDSPFSRDIGELARTLLPARVPAGPGADRIGLGKRLLGMVRK